MFFFIVYSSKMFYYVLIFYETFVIGNAGITPEVKISDFHMLC